MTRTRVIFAIVAALLGTLLGLPAQPASALAGDVGAVPDGWEVDPQPVSTWGVATLLPSETVVFKSLVWDFAEIDGAPIALGGSLSYAWDNRVYSLFPLQGARIAVGVRGGGTPATGETYLSLSGSFVGQVAPTPRHVFAGKLSAGIAWSDIPQRRLSFGGSTGVRGIPDDAVQTERQAITSLEYRPVLMRQGSLPLLLTWVREIQLIAGFDIGTGWRSDGPNVAAMGANAGLGVIVDNLGISPGAVNLTFGVPLWHRGIDLQSSELPFELYLSWGQMY